MQHRTLTATLERAADGGPIPCVLTTADPVERSDEYGEPYSEILACDNASVDLSRAPLPLLVSHNSRELPIGQIINIRATGREVRGELVLGQSTRAREIEPDIRSGLVSSLSVGYVILHHQRSGDTLTATRWQPHEVSLVAVPADPRAGTYRSKTMHNEIDDNTETLTRSQRRAAREAEEQQQRADQRAAIIERQRITGITDAVRAAKLPDEMAEQLIEDGTPIEAARAAVLAKLGERPQPREGFHHPANVREDDFTQAAADALLIRSGMRVLKPHRDAASLTGLSVFDMASRILGRAGLSVPSNKIITRAMGTSDFPALLENVLHKALRLGSESEAATHRQWCRVTPVDDFRARKRPAIGSAPELLAVAELGTYTHGSLTDGEATIPAVTKYGRLVQLSFEALRNDDVGGFARVVASMGAAAMRAEADHVYSKITEATLDGQDLDDAVALFDASRNNAVTVATGTGKPLTAAALGQARAKLRRQTALGGGYLNLAPRTLLVPPEREHEAEVLVAAATVHTATAGAEAPGGWLTGLQVVAEPRLANTDTCYVLADSGAIDTLELLVLDGGPTYEQEDGFETDAITWKVRHAFSGSFVDFRGIVKLTLTVS